MTAVSTILSICILPLNLLLYTRYSYEADVIKELDWPSLFIALFIVISAIALGLYCSYRIKSFEFNRRANQVGNFSGVALILFSATVTNTGDSDSKIWARDWDFYVAVSAPCILGLVVANIIATLCHLRRPERV
jgi:predicted Na+-dependent transporter